MRPARRDHDVVDRARQIPKKPLEKHGIAASKAAVRSAPSSLAARCSRSGSGRQDHVGSLDAYSSRRFEPDAGAPADHDDGLPAQIPVRAEWDGFEVTLLMIPPRAPNLTTCGKSLPYRPRIFDCLFRSLASLARDDIGGVPARPVMLRSGCLISPW